MKYLLASDLHKLPKESILVDTCSGEYICHASETQTGWSPRSERPVKRRNGSISTKTAGNLKLGVSRNRFCDFLADPDSRSFSRFTLIFTGAGTSLVQTLLVNEMNLPRLRKHGPFFEFSLCLSRACLGRMFVFKYKRLKKTVFTHRFKRQGVDASCRNAKRRVLCELSFV
eukprot:COSAG06_NODE_5497_length_3442_cov_3.036195_4_plen_171_part_00